mmetsp:Transcript_15435/g.43187  ORF Transcript_15435/g.43187 Transcript_15435/m.43187 type:complete len:266 (-) Transcript_15435:258-1055(-)
MGCEHPFRPLGCSCFELRLWAAVRRVIFGHHKGVAEILQVGDDGAHDGCCHHQASGTRCPPGKDALWPLGHYLLRERDVVGLGGTQHFEGVAQEGADNAPNCTCQKMPRAIWNVELGVGQGLFCDLVATNHPPVADGVAEEDGTCALPEGPGSFRPVDCPHGVHHSGVAPLRPLHPELHKVDGVDKQHLGGARQHSDQRGSAAVCLLHVTPGGQRVDVAVEDAVMYHRLGDSAHKCCRQGPVKQCGRQPGICCQCTSQRGRAMPG